MRALALIAAASTLVACGNGKDVRFVVETEGEARAIDLELRVGDEARFFDAAPHGKEIIESAVATGTGASLQATNGGDAGRLTLRAFVDDCEIDVRTCEGAACVARVAVFVRDDSCD